jgi:hypothetical protein
MVHCHRAVLRGAADVLLPDDAMQQDAVPAELEGLSDDASLADLQTSKDQRPKARLGRLQLGEQFAYVFDLGDNWQHLCTVADGLADPMEALGIIPDRPVPWWGWGSIPDTSTAVHLTHRHWPPAHSAGQSLVAVSIIFL